MENDNKTPAYETIVYDTNMSRARRSHRRRWRSPSNPPPPIDDLHHKPQWVDCPYCKNRMKTKPRYHWSPWCILLNVLLFPFGMLVRRLHPKLEHWCTECGRRIAKLSGNGTMYIFDLPSSEAERAAKESFELSHPWVAQAPQRSGVAFAPVP
ncbi:LPS-induced tumor necrosis factor alpha factor [Moelleriella libera RCEF 2490]|uniref:LPS-induced tumor necrosis factor alpha factor n=1 Tax=Moelleriella libera RCEF 2490 TaxID=1081109 RepID=A0A168BKK0_9HYPO|nr:LPS-induced tumor necrosis factor alpha factor [Moelleriella libera RCEF 2490]